MNQSESVKGLMAALSAAQASFKAVPKSADNPFFKSKFAPLVKIVEYAGPILVEHGLIVSQDITTIAGEDGTLVDALETTLYHLASGEFKTRVMMLHPVKLEPNAQASAITYARRYAYVTTLGLQVDKDDDGAAGSGQGGRPARQATTNTEESGEGPSAPLPFTPSQQEIISHPVFMEMEREKKGEFVSDAVGYPVGSLRELDDEDCDKVLFRLNPL